MHIIIRCGTNPIVSDFEWEIPNKFKQQVFEFLESLANREKVDSAESHIEMLISNEEVRKTINELFQNLHAGDFHYRTD